MISTVVITRDKANAKKCLESLRWCDEVLVLENDNLTDYAAQRNLGLEKAKNEWVLFVDDDEVVTDELKREILDAARMTGDRRMTKKVEGFFIKRLDFFGGNFLRFGEAGNIKLLRLGKKNAGTWHRKVHEVWDIRNTADLKNPLYHYPHQTIRKFLSSINIYTDLDVVELNREGKTFSIFRLFFNPPGKFIRNFFLKLGFLDGGPGFVMAFMMSLHSLIARVKQYEIG